jgi:hypothetical protein
VDIIGVGERNNIIIESVSRPVLSFRAIKGIVRNLVCLIFSPPPPSPPLSPPSNCPPHTHLSRPLHLVLSWRGPQPEPWADPVADGRRGSLPLATIPRYRLLSVILKLHYTPRWADAAADGRRVRLRRRHRSRGPRARKLRYFGAVRHRGQDSQRGDARAGPALIGSN